MFNVLDVGIVEHRDMERANSAAIQGQVKLLQEGEIEYSEFQVSYYELKAEAGKLDQLRLELIYARNVVTYIRNEFNYDRGGIPSWFDSMSYLDIIEATKGYPSP